MLNEKEKEMLKQASAELKMLRLQNQRMGGRLEMFDAMMLLFTTRPEYRGEGMSPDISNQIDNYLHNVENGINAGSGA